MEQKLNLLIADDDEDTIQLLRTHTERNFPQMKIFTAGDGAKVLKSLESIEFQFLFLDLNLPKYDGRKILQAVSFLKKQNRPQHIFIISGENLANVEVSSASSKLHYFSKPVDFPKLKQTIENIINPSKQSAAPKVALDVKFMNPFIDATLNVLKVTTDTDCVKEEMNIAKGEGFKGDISAFYPIHSPVFQGFFCISFPKETYLKIMSRMLYSEFTEINDENVDGVGELCNQIFGNAKAFFNDKFNTSIQMATPSITVGADHKVSSVLKTPRVVVRFATELGHFFVEVSFAKIG
jgi:CheY-specific phosphatase CheX/CheY-like chemotaxis protein